MTTKMQAARNALDKIDAPDNSEQDRMREATAAVAAIKKLPEAEQVVLAHAEIRRFLDWLTNRR